MAQSAPKTSACRRSSAPKDPTVEQTVTPTTAAVALVPEAPDFTDPYRP